MTDSCISYSFTDCYLCSNLSIWSAARNTPTHSITGNGPRSWAQTWVCTNMEVQWTCPDSSRLRRLLFFNMVTFLSLKVLSMWCLLNAIKPNCPNISHSPPLEKWPHEWFNLYLMGAEIRQLTDWCSFKGLKFATSIKHKISIDIPILCLQNVRQWRVSVAKYKRGLVGVKLLSKKFKNYVNWSGNFYNPVKVKDKFRYILPGPSPEPWGWQRGTLDFKLLKLLS